MWQVMNYFPLYIIYFVYFILLCFVAAVNVGSGVETGIHHVAQAGLKLVMCPLLSSAHYGLTSFGPWTFHTIPSFLFIFNAQNIIIVDPLSSPHSVIF